MEVLTSQQIESRKEDILCFFDDFEEILSEKISEQRYTSACTTISEFAEKKILWSMIAHRHDKDVDAAKQSLIEAQISATKIQSLAELLLALNGVDTKYEPNCLLPFCYEYITYAALLNRGISSVEVLLKAFNSDVTEKDGGFPFAQQFAPLLMLGALDKKTEFLKAYSKFTKLKKGACEQWYAHYVDMLAAIVERDQERFDSLLLEAESQMKNHGTSKKWGATVMSGGLEYNSIVYDYQGTAMCCLALIRGMQVNHFSCYYPEEVIFPGA